ncbi:hypothetical protein HMJ29_08390 [Hymenobacter taeanensis]|uniref:DUF3300 domain-containing protein n=1 Tax=Hymenobacter taeanensis TaxID=2735321 RepID=A0A6M6BG16_9BACT|nr:MULTISPECIES: hypothetical protein [Hymenobacter]QJX46950.1 hypothetical protein HMJ29_08390 [Hymenobacter taeanensis]UOQ80829.1 hypothetical protein MUN83_18755 [Hymenobacter sp. 5414T-23]
MKLLLKSAFLLALGLLVYTEPAQAQVQIQVGINQPYWGPPVPQGVQYYYIPEIDGYYDLYSQSYLFFDPVYGAWVSSPVLPRAYASYDPRFFHPVVIQYVGRQPWGYLRDHRAYCNNWGVLPGRYYGANWPGRGYYAVPPRGGYYGNRPYNQGGYASGNYHNDRGGYYGNGRNDNRGGYDRNDNRGGYDNRGNDNRGGYDRNDNWGNGNRGSGFDRNDNRGSQASQGAPSGGRGRGRVN